MLKGRQSALCFLLLLISFSTYAKSALTIYSTSPIGTDLNYLNRAMSYSPNFTPSIPGYAIIQEHREIILTEGSNLIPYTNVPAYIDPTTVTFQSITDPKGTQILDQSYHFDLINNQRLLQKYLGQEVTVEQSHGDQIETLSGTLLNASGELVLQHKNGSISSMGNYSKIRFSTLPNDLILKPTLLWNLYAQKSGKHSIKTSYQTKGFTWWTNYNATYDALDNDQGFLELSAWANIVNQSGMDFQDITLKLVAGDVNKVSTTQMRGMAMMSKAQDMRSNEFQEKSLFEFHLYTLDQKTTLLDNSTKQIALFPNKTKIPVKKEYIYQDNRDFRYSGYVNKSNASDKQFPGKIHTYLKFKNDEKEGLGIPLPAGRIRVNKLDEKNGTTEFIGEDIIAHTPNGEEILIKMGSAYDIIGHKKQLDFTIDNKRRMMDETFEITLKNRKDHTVNVTVKEDLYRGSNWKILDSSAEYKKTNSQTIHFPVLLKKDGEIKLRYTVQYTW